MPKYALAEVWKLMDRALGETRELVNKVDESAAVSVEFMQGMDGVLAIDKNGNATFMGRLFGAPSAAIETVAEAGLETEGGFESERRTDLDTKLTMTIKVNVNRPAKIGG